MTEALITIFVSLGTGMAAAFSGWFFGRKKQNIEAIDMALDTWKKVIDQLEGRVEVLLRKVDELQNENVALKEEIAMLKAEIMTSKSDKRKIEQLERKVAKYEKILIDNNIDY